MESVGQKLREARRRSGRTLDEISERTRISVKSLAAIEADDLEAISSRFFYKSFVWQMAASVGLAKSELEAAFQSAYESMPEALLPGQPGAPIPPKLSSLQPAPVRASRWFYSVALFVLMLAACSAVFAYWQDNRVGASPVTRATKSSISPAISQARVPGNRAMAGRNVLVPTASGNQKSGSESESPVAHLAFASLKTGGE